MQIAAVGRALPKHFSSQQQLTSSLMEIWGDKLHNPARLADLHKNVLVSGRYTALPLQDYRTLSSFGAANDAFIQVGTDLAEEALMAALKQTGQVPRDIDHIFFVSVTGIATPSIDARLVNRLNLRPDIKRTPIFGLGCVAGAAGIARAADYVRAFPGHTAALVSVELCSLTLQRQDFSVANLIASGLFGDGCAAVLVHGAEVSSGLRRGPKVVTTRSVFYPHTEDVMGWTIGDKGFGIVLSADVPKVVFGHIKHDVESFLQAQHLGIEDISAFVCHPGGPKVLTAFEQALDLPSDALALTHQSLKTVGNLSSVSVLMVLADTMAETKPSAGSYGLLIALGPGFCAELVLLQW